MSEKPEALRLADRLDLWGDQGDLLEAAAELRRLHAECDALRADAERLEWIEAQWRDGIHIECCAHGDGTTWHAMKPASTVYVGSTVYAKDTLRAAIDAARAALKEAK